VGVLQDAACLKRASSPGRGGSNGVTDRVSLLFEGTQVGLELKILLNGLLNTEIIGMNHHI
jgi:hypothetical protein